MLRVHTTSPALSEFLKCLDLPVSAMIIIMPQMAGTLFQNEQLLRGGMAINLEATKKL